MDSFFGFLHYQVSASKVEWHSAWGPAHLFQTSDLKHDLQLLPANCIWQGSLFTCLSLSTHAHTVTEGRKHSDKHCQTRILHTDAHRLPETDRFLFIARESKTRRRCLRPARDWKKPLAELPPQRWVWRNAHVSNTWVTNSRRPFWVYICYPVRIK